MADPIKMPKISITLGILILMGVAWNRIAPYFGGLEFRGSPSYFIIDIFVLFSGLILLISLLLILDKVLHKKAHIKTLMIALVLPSLVVGSYWVPVPGFLDGMHKTVETRLEREKLMQLAAHAREKNINWISGEGEEYDE